MNSSYIARDIVDGGNSNISFVHILVRSIEYWAAIKQNNPPNAIEKSYTMTQATSLQGLLHANDDHDTMEQLIPSIAVEPLHGLLEVDGWNFTYRPDAGYWGNDTFIFVVG